MAQSWTIGSAPGCDLVADQPGVSARHCRLTWDGRRFTVEDLGSTNGTHVNGSRIDGPAPVTRADAITLGLAASMPWPPEAAPAARAVRIGRDEDNDVVVDLPMVSGHHAVVTRDGDSGGAIIEDLGSANGTALGAPDRKVARSALRAGDIIYLGSHALAASHVLARLDPALAPALLFHGAPLVLGRDPACHRSLDFPMISGRHARLTRDGDRVVIEDLGSANGTFVGGRRISGPTPVAAGDLIGLGSYTTRLVLGAPAAAPSPDRPLQAPQPPAGGPIPGPGLAVPAALLAQAPVLALAIAAISGRSPAGAASAACGLAVAAAWFGLSNAALLGRLGGRGSSPGARVAIAAGLGVAQCVAAWFLTAWLAGLAGPWWSGLSYLIPCSAVGLAAGLAVAAPGPRPPVAWAGVGAVALACWLLGGGPHALPRTAPAVAAASALAPSRWAFEGLLLAESADQAEVYFPVESGRMGGRAALEALAFLLVGASATSAYLIWAMGPARRARAGL